MVEDGYAEAYRKFPFEHKNEFLALEKIARDEKRGMWSGKKSSFASDFMEVFRKNAKS